MLTVTKENGNLPRASILVQGRQDRRHRHDLKCPRRRDGDRRRRACSSCRASSTRTRTSPSGRRQRDDAVGRARGAGQGRDRQRGRDDLPRPRGRSDDRPAAARQPTSSAGRTRSSSSGTASQAARLILVAPRRRQVRPRRERQTAHRGRFPNTRLGVEARSSGPSGRPRRIGTAGRITSRKDEARLGRLRAATCVWRRWPTCLTAIRSTATATAPTRS